MTDHRVPGASILGGVQRVLSGDCLPEIMDAVAKQRRDEALDELLSRQQQELQDAAAAGEGPS